MSKDDDSSQIRANFQAVGSVLLLPILGLSALLSVAAFLAMMICDFLLVVGFLFSRAFSMLWLLFPALTLLSVWNIVASVEAMADPTIRKALVSLSIIAVIAAPFISLLWSRGGL